MRIVTYDDIPKSIRHLFRGLEQYNFAAGVVRYDYNPHSLLYNEEYFKELISKYGRLSATLDLFLKFRRSVIISFSENVEFKPLCYTCTEVLRINRYGVEFCMWRFRFNRKEDSITPLEFEVYTTERPTPENVEAVLVPRSIEDDRLLIETVIRAIERQKGIKDNVRVETIDFDRDFILNGAAYRVVVESLFCPDLVYKYENDLRVKRDAIIKTEKSRIVLHDIPSMNLLLGMTWDYYMGLHDFYDTTIINNYEEKVVYDISNMLLRKAASIAYFFGYTDIELVERIVDKAVSISKLIVDDIPYDVLGFMPRFDDWLSMSKDEKKIKVASFVKVNKEAFGVFNV